MSIIRSMSEVGRDSIDEILNALGEHLDAAGAATRLVVIGGSGLLGIGIGGRATEDVDVVALEHDGRLITAEPLPPRVQAAAHHVARDFGLIDGWLNAGPTSLLSEASGLPPDFADRIVWNEYGPALAVGFASRFDQIHLKLMALADRGYARDRSDLERLAPTRQELQEAAAWVRSHFMPGPLQDRLDEALDELGIDGDSREP